MTNTEEVPEQIDSEVLERDHPASVRKQRPFYAYIVAALGALFVLGGAFLAIMLIPTVLFPAIYESIAGVVLMYVVGVPLAILAAALSFRATLRAYSNR
jgi:preprotein translocase subunit SecY